MSCSGCNRGRANLNIDEEKGIKRIPGCTNKLDIYDWLSDLPRHSNSTDLVEVRFKNTRKAFYRNVNSLRLRSGDVVAASGLTTAMGIEPSAVSIFSWYASKPA